MLFSGPQDRLRSTRYMCECATAFHDALACFRNNLRNAVSSAARFSLNRRWRSAFAWRFSSADLRGRPARSESGKSTDGV